MDNHSTLVADIANRIKQHVSSGSTKKLRFKHGSTNSTRSTNGEYEYIDVGALNRVLCVDTDAKLATVEPNVPMSVLVETTLKYGLLPEVVMEFPAITVGGGIQGAGLESSSFKYGQFNDTCVEYELITADGKIIRASHNENADLFYGISSSYGTLAVVTLAKIRLVPATKYVRVTYTRFETAEMLVDSLKNATDEQVDFLEGIIFSAKEAVSIRGSFADTAERVQTFSKARDPWFYNHVRQIIEKAEVYSEYIPIRDYLFRYSRGAFWMGEYVFPLFHLPRGAVMHYIMNPVLNAKKLYEYLHVANVTQSYLIQDYYYPFDTAKEYIRLNENDFQIYPVWLCPIKATSTVQKLSPHYSPGNEMLLNVGMYGQSQKFLDAGYLNANRRIEQFAISNKGRKMFYAHSYYPQEEFWQVYDHSWYTSLRDRYNVGSTFPEIWEKIYVSKKYKPSLYGTLWAYMLKDIGRKLASYFRVRR